MDYEKRENTKNLDHFLSVLDKEIRDMFSGENSGHDIYHLERVRDLALHIQEKEGGDRLVIGISAFLHDIHRLIEKESGKLTPPKESLPIIEEVLNKVEFPKEKIDQVLHCIGYHEEYDFSENGKTAKDLETLILQDADNLDAIGAIGVARVFAFGGAHGRPMWIPEKSISDGFYDDTKLDDSSIHHFYSKLFKLKENMNTETGKKLAEERHKFMEDFVKQFISEWKGER